MSGHLKASEWEVRNVPIKWARLMVRKHHYARGASNTAVYLHGLYRTGESKPYGVAWWIPPTRSCAEANYPEGDWKRVLALSRLVLDPSVPTNGASFLIGRSVRLIRQGAAWECLITYADEWQGHTGAIYAATNWDYRGKTKPQPTWVDPRTGRMVAKKAGPKTRTSQEMKALGYVLLGSFRRHRFRMLLGKIRNPKQEQRELFAL